MERTNDLSGAWTQYYEDADRRRRKGFEDPFSRHRREVERRRLTWAIALGTLEIVLIVAFVTFF